MPRSQSPRKKRGTPQHLKDLQVALPANHPAAPDPTAGSRPAVEGGTSTSSSPWRFTRGRLAATGVVAGGATALLLHRRRKNMVSKAAPDRVMGFSTPMIGNTRLSAAPRLSGNMEGQNLETAKLRSRRGYRNALGQFTHKPRRSQGTRLNHFTKAVSGPHGQNLPDRVMGASTPEIGQTRQIAALKPTGRHVADANKVDCFYGLKGYKQGPRTTALGHYKKERDKAARQFVGKAQTRTARNAAQIVEDMTSKGRGPKAKKPGFLQAYLTGRRGDVPGSTVPGIRGKINSVAGSTGRFVRDNPVEASVIGSVGGSAAVNTRIGGRREGVGKAMTSYNRRGQRVDWASAR